VTARVTVWPLTSATVGALPWGNSTVRRRRKRAPLSRSLCFSHFTEEPRAVAQNDRDAGDRVPDHVAKAAQPGEGNTDLVPLRVQGHAFRRAGGRQAPGGESNLSRISDVELERVAGGERRSQRDGRLMQLARVINVGAEGSHLKSDVFALASRAVDANAFPVERGGDLQRKAGQRGLAVVAHGKQSADGNMLLRRAQMNVEVEGGEGHGLTFGILGGGRGARLNRRLGRGLGGVGDGLAVLVGRAGKDDLAF